MIANPRRRHLTLWIACLAMLLHSLAMPVSATLSPEVKRVLGWGGHCVVAERVVTQSHAHHDAQASAVDAGEHAGHTDAETSSGHHANMQQCCCGAGSALLAGFSADAPSFLERTATSGRLPPAPAVRSQSPRGLWPSLNPRASPAA